MRELRIHGTSYDGGWGNPFSIESFQKLDQWCPNLKTIDCCNLNIQGSDDESTWRGLTERISGSTVIAPSGYSYTQSIPETNPSLLLSLYRFPDLSIAQIRKRDPSSARYLAEDWQNFNRDMFRVVGPAPYCGDGLIHYTYTS